MADETIENADVAAEETAAVEPAAEAEAAAPAPKRASRAKSAKARSEGETPEAVEEAAPAAAAEEPVAEEPVAEAEAPAPEKPAAKPRTRAAKPKAAPEPTPAPKKERGTYVRTPAGEPEAGIRRERRGVVVSDKGDKSITVRVDVMKAHPKYKKIMRRSVKLHAHDEQNVAKVGDVVRVVETRPLSRTKRWRLVEVVEAAR